MAEKTDLGEFVFDLMIAGAGPYWGEPFRMAAEKEFGSPGLSGLSGAARGWAIAAGMVRTGLYLCERRDAGLYHDFLTGLLAAIVREMDLLPENDDAGEVWNVPWHVFKPGNEFMSLAEGILAERIVDEPRAVSFALIREGLRFCEDFAPERYTGFVGKVSALLFEEAERVKGAPRLLTRRAAPQARTSIRVLTATFNKSAGAPAVA